jgi:flagellar biosynthesis protein
MAGRDGKARERRQPRKTAVALGYDQGRDEAPRVLAAGQGLVAEEMIRQAVEHKVPVHRDPALAEALARLEVGGVIPPELYAAVAEVLAFLWSVEQEAQHDLWHRP